jgi:hypothetical protein
MTREKNTSDESMLPSSSQLPSPLSPSPSDMKDFLSSFDHRSSILPSSSSSSSSSPHSHRKIGRESDRRQKNKTYYNRDYTPTEYNIESLDYSYLKSVQQKDTQELIGLLNVLK